RPVRRRLLRRAGGGARPARERGRRTPTARGHAPRRRRRELRARRRTRDGGLAGGLDSSFALPFASAFAFGALLVRAQIEPRVVGWDPLIARAFRRRADVRRAAVVAEKARAALGRGRANLPLGEQGLIGASAREQQEGQREHDGTHGSTIPRPR